MVDDPGGGERWPSGEPLRPPPAGYLPTRTDGSAVAALVLAILSFVVCPVVFAIVALFLASGARRKIRASGGALEGDSLCTAAVVLAWVNIGLAIAGILLVTLIGVFTAPVRIG